MRPPPPTEQTENKGHQQSTNSLTVTHLSLIIEAGGAVLYLYRRIVVTWGYHPSGFVKMLVQHQCTLALPHHRIVCLGHLHLTCTTM